MAIAQPIGKCSIDRHLSGWKRDGFANVGRFEYVSEFSLALAQQFLGTRARRDVSLQFARALCHLASQEDGEAEQEAQQYQCAGEAPQEGDGQDRFGLIDPNPLVEPRMVWRIFICLERSKIPIERIQNLRMLAFGDGEEDFDWGKENVGRFDLRITSFQNQPIDLGDDAGIDFAAINGGKHLRVLIHFHNRAMQVKLIQEPGQAFCIDTALQRRDRFALEVKNCFDGLTFAAVYDCPIEKEMLARKIELLSARFRVPNAG